MQNNGQRLVYEQVKDVLSEQENAASALDGKTSTQLALATVVIAIGLPIGFGRITMDISWAWAIAVGLATIVPLALYGLALFFGIKAYRLRSFVTLNDPIEIRQKLGHLESDLFIREMLLNIEKKFVQNRDNLDKKTDAVTKLFPVVIWECITVLLWSGLVLFVSLALTP